MGNPVPKTSVTLVIAIAAATAGIFVADLRLVLGIAVWVLYFGPLALSFFVWRQNGPLITAAVCTTLVVGGFFLDAGHGEEAAKYASINRTFGFVSLWVTGFIGRRFVGARLEMAKEDWFKAVEASLSAKMVVELNHAQLGANVLGHLCEQLGAQVGALYLVESDRSLRRFAGHALDPGVAGPERLAPGEGLVGQTALDRKLRRISQVPEHQLDLRSGTGILRPRALVIAPAFADGEVRAVVELGFLDAHAQLAEQLLPRLSESIGTAVRSVNYRQRQADLLEETQRQAEELQAQQEELRVQNEELEEQTRALQESQQLLTNQQEELKQINVQLEEQSQALQTKQGELQKVNAYKSEFLANMSHELRTPLNSSLILARLLAENRDQNLTPEQVQFAQTIHSAGNDLLLLINDILDLSKIEAGKLDVRPELVPLPRILGELEATFRPIANDRKLQLSFGLEPHLPHQLFTDPARVAQILKNLLSNALKFTNKGGVTLSVRRAGVGRVAFDVRDTGIGIPPDKHEVIFEAFRQADGSTNRKYGGTGLGLSISRDLAKLLGGALALTSESGRGSTFTLTLPERFGGAAAVPPAPARPRDDLPAPVAVPPVADDRAQVTPGARSILLVEDDPHFVKVLTALVHEKDFKALIANTGDDALLLAEKYRPSAILLDIGLPDRSGLSVLDTLKHNPSTRHIPVHVLSADDFTQAALEMGAVGYAVKPVQREQVLEAIGKLESKFTQKLRRVLVVEDDPNLRMATQKLLGKDDVEALGVGTAREALALLKENTFDCLVLDLSLPDQSGIELLQEMSGREEYGFPPVIVYTGRSLSEQEEAELRRFSQSIIVKGARSPERLLAEVTLFLHQVESELPPEQQRMLREARNRESIFENRRVLIVEDDVRNIFALSRVLEPRGAKVEIARNGKEALSHLDGNPGVDLVLMDIMMPEMDGLQATQAIRKKPELSKLPIIALTAKAMPDDRDKCLAAGANDYIAKPLDVDKLLSLVRVWMPR